MTLHTALDIEGRQKLSLGGGVVMPPSCLDLEFSGAKLRLLPRHRISGNLSIWGAEAA